MSETGQLKKLLSTPKNVAILTHRNPDGDAIGSSLAVKLLLEQMHHRCRVILPSDFPVVFEFLPGIKDAMIYDNDPEACCKTLEWAEIIFFLDFNGLDRVEKMALTIADSKAYKVLIDHHLDPEPFADYYLTDTGASSTCELVYRFVRSLGYQNYLSLEIADCLFTGIITDTGSFKYGTNPEVYRMAADLKEIGVDDYALQDAIFNSWTERQLNILGHALRNRLEVLPEWKTGIIRLTKGDYLKYQISRGDTEGVVNYILMIKGIELAAFIREMPLGEIRLSLRSKGDISVQEIASKHFNGGGHKNASGGTSDLDLQGTIERFKQILPLYIKQQL